MNSLEHQSVNPSTAQSRQNHATITSSQRCSNCKMALPAGARFCLNCGQPLGERTATDQTHLINLVATAPPPLVEKVRAAANLTGERRLVTAVFVDIVGSTALSEQIGSASWSAIMGKSCDWFCSVIYRYEGTIARFVGDELLAFFGAPVAHEDDPVRAVHAALEILDTVTQRAANIRQEFEVDFGVRISLSTGPVTIGPVSSDLQFEYSALEGTLNLAAELEATKRSMAVLLSEETYRLVAPFFNCVDLGAMGVKGQAEAVHMYQVRSERSRSVRGAQADSKRAWGAGPRLHGELESPMVGRDSELQALLQLTEAVAAGLGRAVLIVGESGLGKTRLISEWKTAVAQTSHQPPRGAAPRAGVEWGSLQWAEGHCLSYSQRMAYHLLRDLLRSLIGVSTTASEPETRAALRSLSAQLFGDSALDVYPYLGHLLLVVLEDEALERIQPLDPPALQAQYLAAFKRLVAVLAARGPLVLLLEDLQWADPSSTAILSQLLPLAAATPLLFCLVTRPHRDTPGWKLVTASRETMGGRFTELRLKILTQTDSQQIISNLLQIDALPENVQHLILKKAEGNPFFIEEVLRMMIDQGAIQRQNGGWAFGNKIGTMGIPDSLQGLLPSKPYGWRR
jgi:class 3 adenylate cyclase